jgi:hypothetical protein
LPEADADYESHTRRLLRYTDLEAVLWANIGIKLVAFTSITKKDSQTEPRYFNVAAPSVM